MNDTTEVPAVTETVVVHDTALIDQAWTALRQIAPPVMAFVLGRGWIGNDMAVLLGLVGGVAWPIVAGQLKTRKRAQLLTQIGQNPRNKGVVLASQVEA